MFAIPTCGFHTSKLAMLGSVFNHHKSIDKKFTMGTKHFISNNLVSDSQMSISPPLNQENVAAIIFGDGPESGLCPLTKRRSDGAIPILANYRLIDIVVSNCISSNITKIYAITQFNSTSLNSHLSRAYTTLGWEKEGFLQVLAAYQSPEEQSWFQGTADAIRRCLWVLEEHPVTELLILPGHHLYRMDYQDLIQAHRNSNADITVAVSSKTNQNHQSEFLKVNNKNQVTEYIEKLDGKNGVLTNNLMDMLSKSQAGSSKLSDDAYLASMGIYIIKTDVIIKLLTKFFPNANHFGSQIISGAISMGMKVHSFAHDGHWDNMSSIGAFYQANMDSTKRTTSGLNYYDSALYTLPRCFPPSLIEDAIIVDSIIGDGCHFDRCKIKSSVIGMRTWIGDGAVVEDSIIFGIDTHQMMPHCPDESDMEIPIGIGEQAHIKKAIIDRNARIGRNVKILNVDNVQEGCREDLGYVIKDGIVIVLRNAVIPNDSIL